MGYYVDDIYVYWHVSKTHSARYPTLKYKAITPPYTEVPLRLVSKSRTKGILRARYV